MLLSLIEWLTKISNVELSSKTALLFGAILFTGLSAGIFYAWAFTVIPGTQRVDDATYLKVMQPINRAILNPGFFLVFFGGGLLPALAGFGLRSDFKAVFWLLLAATVVYLLGTIGTTIFGNVPLNDRLDGLDLTELTADRYKAFRGDYEKRWNRWHAYRTAAAVGSFVLTILAALLSTSSN